MLRSLSLLALIAASPVVAEGARELSAHEHGVGELNIAVAGSDLVIELHAPGADIVGFEHAAESDADKAAVEAALAVLGDLSSVIALPAAAECSVSAAEAELHIEGAHEDHDDHDEHEAHGHDDHHDDHKEHDDHKDHDDHAHEDHKDHDAHDHDEHDHAEEAGGHSEFEASYTLTCAAPDQIETLDFAYFGQFENARELHVQIASDAGAQAFDVERDAAALDVKGLF